MWRDVSSICLGLTLCISAPQIVMARDVNILSVQVSGSNAFSDRELKAVTNTFVGKPASDINLEQLRESVALLYSNAGFTTSLVNINDKNVDSGVVKLEVTEGNLERIDISGLQVTNPDYVRSRLALVSTVPFNTAKMEEGLRLLETDPIFKSVRGKIQSGSTIGSSILKVDIVEASQFGGGASIDNYSPPALGSERLNANLLIRNLSGNGDILSAASSNTIGGGSNVYDLSYSIPVSPLQGTVSLRYAPSTFRVIQKPFDVLNLGGNSSTFELAYRQPLIRNLSEELAVSVTYSYQTGQTFVDNIATAFSIGRTHRAVRLPVFFDLVRTI